MKLPQAEQLVAGLRRFDRPLWCTEYMARPTGSTFPVITPWLREQGIGAYNWGLVAGRTQTHLAWDTWRSPCEGEPGEWFHDILRADGTPYREEEAEVLRREATAARRHRAGAAT